MSRLMMKDLPKYRYIMEIIRDRITNGIYKVDNPLPSERILAREFETNHETVNKAISALVAEGLLFRKRGIGTFIKIGNSQTEIKKKVIDILLYKHAKELFGAPSFHEEILFSLQRLIISRGFVCNIIPVKDIDSFESYIQTTDAIVTSKFIPYRYIEKILKADKPIIGINFEFIPAPITSIIIDNKAFDLLAYHLIKNNHKEIGYVHSSDYNPTHQIRLIRFRNFMHIMELENNMNRIYTIDLNNESQSSKLIKNMQTCTALIAADDLIAIKLKHLLNRFNIRIPDEISITGFGNLSITQSLFPELSTADVDRNELCTIIGDTISDLLEKHKHSLSKATTIQFSSHPVIRKSVKKL